MVPQGNRAPGFSVVLIWQDVRAVRPRVLWLATGHPRAAGTWEVMPAEAEGLSTRTEGPCVLRVGDMDVLAPELRKLLRLPSAFSVTRASGCLP